MKRIFFFCFLLLAVSSQFLTSEALGNGDVEPILGIVGDFYQETIQIWRNMTNYQNSPEAFSMAVDAMRASYENAVKSLQDIGSTIGMLAIRRIERFYKIFNDTINAVTANGERDVTPLEAMRNGSFMGAILALFRGISEIVYSFFIETRASFTNNRRSN